MCGIAGIVSLSSRPVQAATARLQRMNELLRHRGPDQDGSWVSDDGLLALANTRLSIVGISDRFQLPLRDANGRGCITFNGEVYNHKELRASLAAQGYDFRTHTDTEVLLAGLLSEGLDFLDQADGFWSFGFYERASRRLHLARDVMGEKGLYYAINGDELIFASEVPPILAVMAKPATWNMDAVATSFQYRAAPSGETLLNQVSRLQAGMVLTLTPGRREQVLRRRQRLNPDRWREFFARGPALAEVLDLFEEKIQLACQRRVPNEVDYISTLSGGIDSTLINVFLSDRGRRPISSLYAHSAAVSPRRGGDLSEYDASCFTARKLGTDQHEFALYGEDTAALHAEDAAASFDGIFCEAVNNFRELARYAKSVGKRVLVTSDGPDELFGGYDVDLRAYRLSMRSQMCAPAEKNAMIARAFDAAHMAGKSGSLINWAYLQSVPFAVRPNHGGTHPDVMLKLFEPKLAQAPAKKFGQIPVEYRETADNLDLSQKIALGYACSSLPDYVNTRSDRGTMRESIELRLPFQAPYVAELFIATPAALRFRDARWSKYILRKLVARHIGDQVAYRGKYGFAEPIWRNADGARKLRMRETVADSSIFEVFPFRKGARDFLIRTGEERHCWMAFCLTKTYERVQREFSRTAAMALQS
jgi:asparagine synthase (glutamine-hydrolysing)